MFGSKAHHHADVHERGDRHRHRQAERDELLKLRARTPGDAQSQILYSENIVIRKSMPSSPHSSPTAADEVGDLFGNEAELLPSCP